MKGSFALLAAVVLFCGFASPVWSQQTDDNAVHRHTSAGHDVLIRTHAQWNTACVTEEPPDITVVTPPSHGHIDMRVGDAALGSTYVGNAHCEGHPGQGMQVIYIPDTGYRGADSVAYEVRYHRGQGKVRTVIAEIDVD